MSTPTELRIEYAYYSWEYDFPQKIDDALEHDYVVNRPLYNDNTLKRINLLLLIHPNATARDVIEIVRAM